MTHARDLRYALVQFSPVWENIRENLVRLDQLMNQIEQCDLIVLPEMFSTGFSMNTSLAEAFPGDATRWMQKTAQAKNVLLCGSIMCSEHGSFYNRLIMAFPDGSIRHYDKKHLFKPSDEDRFYSPGKQILIAEYKGWRIAPFICYDIRFPEWLRNVRAGEHGVEAKYDLLIVVASWPAKRAYAWNQLCIARAIENQSPLLAVNRCGEDGNGFHYEGDSMALDSLGRVLQKTDAKEVIVSGSISRAEMELTRTQFPFLQAADPHPVRD